MSRPYVDDDDDSDWGEESNEEAPDWEPDSTSDDDSLTVTCPYCKHQIHEDSVRCPHCENYISAEDSPPLPKALWIILGAVAALVACYLWII